MSNEIENKIQKLRDSLVKDRGTGRTDKMLDKVIAQVAGDTGQKIIVFALTNSIAEWVSQRFVEKLPSFTSIDFRPGNCLVVNENTIMFKGLDYENSTGYKYQEWDGNYWDNSIADSQIIKHIQHLEREIETPITRANRGKIDYFPDFSV